MQPALTRCTQVRILSPLPIHQPLNSEAEQRSYKAKVDVSKSSGATNRARARTIEHRAPKNRLQKANAHRPRFGCKPAAPVCGIRIRPSMPRMPRRPKQLMRPSSGSHRKVPGSTPGWPPLSW